MVAKWYMGAEPPHNFLLIFVFNFILKMFENTPSKTTGVHKNIQSNQLNKLVDALSL